MTWKCGRWAMHRSMTHRCSVLSSAVLMACSSGNEWAPPDDGTPKASSREGISDDGRIHGKYDHRDDDGGAAATERDGGSTGNSWHQTPSASTPEESTAVSSFGVPPPVSPNPDLTAPWAACGGELPTSFKATCSGCHPATGATNSRYPDLHVFLGDEAAFVAKVRAGGGAMNAYSDAVISDADLSAVFVYFTQQHDRVEVSPTFKGVEVLFEAGDGNKPPIVFTRKDGALITRGAGRVRQRHESEGTFNPFGPHYFEDRSYGFIVEDYTPLGESLIRVSYLPTAMPTDGTNFRAWKIYDNGNVFYANTGMDVGQLPALDSPITVSREAYTSNVADFAMVQVKESTHNPRSEAPITSGDVFEFEFGIFIQESAVRDGSRTSYYTDTFRYQAGVGGLTARSDDTNGLLGPTLEAQQGGEGTNVWLYEDQEFAFEQMALNIQHENAQPFLRGRRLFHTDFESGEHSERGNPAFQEQAGKLGPLFVAKRCESCHVHNGPGAPLTTFDQNASTVFKLYGDLSLGGQLQLQEGEVDVSLLKGETLTLPDGVTTMLQQPVFQVRASGRTVERYSPRIARKLIGLGLLEAVAEETLLDRADPEDCNGDGISGRPLLVADPESGRTLLGRFGWKAEKVSIRHQVIDALDGDLGVGTEAVPDSAGNVELASNEIEDLAAYMRLLSVPAQRDVEAEDVQAGRALFQSIGCASCHVTDTVTGANHPFVELRNQAIKPYTDLLLHDMGPGLADESKIVPTSDPHSPPGAQEWRTPPLWGLGWYNKINGNTALLHDGRAATIFEAVLWHGGEAEAAKERFAALDAVQRTRVLTFLESL